MLYYLSLITILFLECYIEILEFFRILISNTKVNGLNKIL
jgi:hypothetical protein